MMQELYTKLKQSSSSSSRSLAALVGPDVAAACSDSEYGSVLQEFPADEAPAVRVLSSLDPPHHLPHLTMYTFSPPCSSSPRRLLLPSRTTRSPAPVQPPKKPRSCARSRSRSRIKAVATPMSQLRRSRLSSASRLPPPLPLRPLPPGRLPIDRMGNSSSSSSNR